MGLESFCSFPSTEENCNQLEELNMIQHTKHSAWQARGKHNSAVFSPRVCPRPPLIQTPVTSILLQVPAPLGASGTLWDTLRGRVYPQPSYQDST